MMRCTLIVAEKKGWDIYLILHRVLSSGEDIVL